MCEFDSVAELRYRLLQVAFNRRLLSSFWTTTIKLNTLFTYGRLSLGFYMQQLSSRRVHMDAYLHHGESYSMLDRVQVSRNVRSILALY
jgi:hypothetical protein